MLIPTHLPIAMASFNALYGVPAFGCFCLHPPAPADYHSWRMTIPWAVQLSGEPRIVPVLVHPPTLPGLAWALHRIEYRVVVAGDEPPAHMGLLNQLLCCAVTHDPEAPTSFPAGAFHAVFHLAPHGPPPDFAVWEGWQHGLSPGGCAIVAFSCLPGHEIHLPDGWRVNGGEPRVVPGCAEFDPLLHENWLSMAFRNAQGAAIAILNCAYQP